MKYMLVDLSLKFKAFDYILRYFITWQPPKENPNTPIGNSNWMGK